MNITQEGNQASSVYTLKGLQDRLKMVDQTIEKLESQKKDLLIKIHQEKQLNRITILIGKKEVELVKCSGLNEKAIFL